MEEVELATMELEYVRGDVVMWTKRLAKYAKAGYYGKTIELFQQMQREGMNPDKFAFISVLNACSHLRALKEGRWIHAQVIKSGWESDTYVANCLVNMYCKCRSILDAQRVFTAMPTCDVVSWNSMIQGYVNCGQGQKALELFREMKLEDVHPDRVTFIGLLNACAAVAALDEGRAVHKQIVHSGCESDISVASRVVNMYAKCGRMEDACRAFNKISKRDVMAWNAMILGYAKWGQGEKALALFKKMQTEKVEVNPVTFVGVLNACASVGALEYGKGVHVQIIQRCYESNIFVACSLINMYGKCGSIEDARRVFTMMPARNVVAWSAMIMGYVKCREGQKALELFQQMQREGVHPDRVTFVGVLNACASLAALDEGRCIHKQIIQSDLESDVFVSSSIVDMYVKCGSIDDACATFVKIRRCNVVSYNAMILGYAKSARGEKALELFQQMQQEGVEPNPVTFVAVLNACASLGALKEGRCVHEQIIRRGLESGIFVCNSLVDMYTKCGSIQDAQRIFDMMITRDVISWNAMILGYVNCGAGQKALDLFQKMHCEGVQPDRVTYVGALNACAYLAALDEGRSVHEQIIQNGCESDIFVASSIVDMYAKCGSIKDAFTSFNKLAAPNVVSWNAMLLGYVKCGEDRKALELSRQMQRNGVGPDDVTFMGMLNACASIAALDEGRRIHQEIIRKGYDSDIRVGNCLVDMYAKCGSIDDARTVFDKLPTCDIVSWTAMLGGYARHGYAKEALQHFERMSKVVEVNGVSFVSLLSACSRGALVDEGLHYFESMISVHGISPTMEHFACVVDLLSRAGHLHKAEDLMTRLPFGSDASLWVSLLGACAVHRNVQMGERAASLLLKLDPGNVAGHVLLSNIYAATGN